MKYSLAQIASQQRPRPPGTVELFPIITEDAGTYASYLKAIRVLEYEMARLIRDVLLPAYGSARSNLRDGDTLLVTDADESTFEQIRAAMRAIASAVSGQIRDIITLASQSHTKKWMAAAKRAFGVDLSAVVRAEDLESYLDAAALRNAGLIKGFSDDLVKTVQQYTTTALIQGKSAKELQAQLKDRLEVSDSRARLIARDQTAKLTSDLNRRRHEDAGIEEYDWRTSHDERVRSLHRKLDGLRYKYGQPTGAEGGLPPGQPIQCRCVAQGVVVF
ncbi:head morphogenesis protein [Rhizobium phage RHph_I65]|nr:head morphogenesis protein [Rhizobium phage RHph_I65]